MIFITSKTHRYISIRTMPSNYMLKKDTRDTKRALAISKSYSKYFEFYKKFIEFSTKKSYEYYEIKYSLSAKECSQEELHELTDIKIGEVENSQIYCIPKKEELDEIFNYIIENAPNYKVLKNPQET